MSSDVITGLNINKGGSDPPLKPDEEYPEWLWKLATREKTLAELRRASSETLTQEDVSLAAGGPQRAWTHRLTLVPPSLPIAVEKAAKAAEQGRH